MEEGTALACSDLLDQDAFEVVADPVHIVHVDQGKLVVHLSDNRLRSVALRNGVLLYLSVSSSSRGEHPCADRRCR